MKTKHEHHKKHEHDRTASKSEPPRFPRYEEFDEIFHTPQEFKSAPPLSFSIDGFLQNGAITIIAGLSDHGKSLMALSITRALLKGPGRKLWNYFDVLENAPRVIYLIPESSIGPLTHRLKLFNIYRYTKHRRLYVQTLSKGLQPDLRDKRLLRAVNGATVLLDSAVRFEKGDENSSTANQRGLGADCFKLLSAGARSVVILHHSAKEFLKAWKDMEKETMLRGSGDIGAMAATVWGIRMLDKERSVIHVENIKRRDFEPCGPFQIIGRPHLDEKHDFRMHKSPGECGSLKEELKLLKPRGGASEKARKERADHNEVVAELLRKYPNATSTEIVKHLKDRGINVKDATVRSLPAWKQRYAPLRTVTN